MSDNDYNPGYSNTLNDFPSEQDIEQKCYNEDDNSAPSIQTIHDSYNKPSYNNDTPTNDSPQTPTNTYGDSNYSNQNNYNNNFNNNFNSDYNNNNLPYNIPQHYVEPQVNRKMRIGESPKLLMILSIILIVIAILGIILQISLDSFSPLILVDNIAILTMAIIYLVFLYKKLRLNHKILGISTILVWFVGFGFEGFGMTQTKKTEFIIANFIITAVRSFSMFFCIPYTCNNYS